MSILTFSLLALVATPKPILNPALSENLRPHVDLYCAEDELLRGFAYQSFANPGYADFMDYVALRCEDAQGNIRQVDSPLDTIGNTSPLTIVDCPNELRGLAYTDVLQLNRRALDGVTPLCGPTNTPAPNPDLNMASDSYVPLACPPGRRAIGARYVDREDVTGTFTDPAGVVSIICDCDAGAPQQVADPQFSANPKPSVDLSCDYDSGEVLVGIVVDGHTRRNGAASDLTDGVGILCAPAWDLSSVRTIMPAEVDQDPSDDITVTCPVGAPPTGVAYLEQGQRGRVDAATLLCGPQRTPLVTADVTDSNPACDPTNGPDFFSNRCGPHDIMVGIAYKDAFTETSTNPDPMDTITAVCISPVCF